MRPDRKYRELKLLMAIERNEITTQRKLANIAGISVAVVNEYIENMNRQGLIQYEKSDGKTFHYRLTPEGVKSKDRMFFEFSKEIVRIYCFIKEEIKERLLKIAQENVKRIALFGGAEIAEVIYHVATGVGLEIVLIVDNDKNKHTKKIGHLTVTSPDKLTQLPLEAVIITSFSHADEIYQQIKHLEHAGIKIYKI